MSLASLASRPQTTPAEAAKERSAPGKVTGRLKRALDAIVWHGLTRAAAAEAANLSEHSLYSALRKPHVKAYYLNELEVLRTSERARNIHRLIEIRDKADNMPAVNAIRMLEQRDDEGAIGGSGVTHSPGVTIRIVHQAPADQRPVIDVTPLAQD